MGGGGSVWFCTVGPVVRTQHFHTHKIQDYVELKRVEGIDFLSDLRPVACLCGAEGAPPLLPVVSLPVLALRALQAHVRHRENLHCADRGKGHRCVHVQTRNLRLKAIQLRGRAQQPLLDSLDRHAALQRVVGRGGQCLDGDRGLGGTGGVCRWGCL